MKVMMVPVRMMWMMRVIQRHHGKTSRIHLIVPGRSWYRRNSGEYFHDNDWL
ncbi:Uncharacterised protein [Salmonella enterica subsp. salamae]|uniref:Uncharacterized protein n=1 Tax=Salmonella enterica subsp. salamae TaxID=59202 RepID=A0A6D2GCW0_SALER|nr:Uncharacterised protein [Salmonella enterica subsp. salamae]